MLNDDRWLRYWRGFGIGGGLIYLVVLLLTPPEAVRQVGTYRLVVGMLTVMLFALAAFSWGTLLRRRIARIRAYVLNRMGE